MSKPSKEVKEERQREKAKKKNLIMGQKRLEEREDTQ